MEQLMDAQIWGHLPEELVYLILAKLPLRNIFRNRVIHKDWNEVMKSPQRNLCCVTDYNFSDRCSTYTRLLFAARENLKRPRAMEITTMKWQAMPSLELPLESMVIEAGAGGLLLISNRNRPPSNHAGCVTLYVCNPLTRACSRLPTINNLSTDEYHRILKQLVFMNVDEAGPSYKIFIFASDFQSSELVIFIYESEGGAWTVVRNEVWPDHDYIPGMVYTSSGVFCKGIIYMLMEDIGENDEGGVSVIGFNTKTRSLTKVVWWSDADALSEASFHDVDLDQPVSLVSCAGKLYIILAAWVRYKDATDNLVILEASEGPDGGLEYESVKEVECVPATTLGILDWRDPEYLFLPLPQWFPAKIKGRDYICRVGKNELAGTSDSVLLYNPEAKEWGMQTINSAFAGDSNVVGENYSVPYQASWMSP